MKSTSIELQTGLKLTVIIGGNERLARRPLYKTVVAALRESGVGGATLTQGILSFGRRRQTHSTMNEVTMENLPIIIEAVGECATIKCAAERIAELLGARGLIQLQATQFERKSKMREGGER
jgi:PII-like signaling protein